MKSKTHVISVRVSEELLEHLHKKADQEKRNMNNYINKVLISGTKFKRKKVS